MSSDNLIEDNILDGNSSGILIQAGSSGNVVAYNYVHRGFDTTSPTTDLKFGLICHGDFANYNLFEGNVITRIGSDNYWGCNRANTFLRNWSRRQGLNETNGEVTFQMIAVRVDATNYYNNFVGNILCSPRDAGDTNSASHLVWEIGEDYDNTTGGTSPGNDPATLSTMLRHGNFDYAYGVTNWDAGYSAHGIPSSYYLASKPSWFSALAWPPIGPDVNVTSSITNISAIPAQARFNGVAY